MAKKIAKKPGAWIVSPCDRGRKSIKNGKVFLNDGDEFEIELFNPLTISVLADIKLNGQSISKTGLVVKPGQRIYLDCFIDNKKKFIFKTYEVEESEEVIEATRNNGLLEVFFYREDVITLDNWKSHFDKIIVEKWYPHYYPYYVSPVYPYYVSPVWRVNSTNSSSFLHTTGSVNTLLGVTGANNSINCSYGNSFSISSNNVCGNTTTNSVETGRVEGGELSKQKFTEVDMDFEKHYVASTIIQILPESRKPHVIKKTNKSLYVIDLIKGLSELLESGIITNEEFQNKKRELLEKI
jgi:hypothetical protein